MAPAFAVKIDFNPENAISRESSDEPDCFTTNCNRPLVDCERQWKTVCESTTLRILSFIHLRMQ